MDELIVEFSSSFVYDGQTYDRLSIPKLKGKHIKGLPVQPSLDDLRLVAQRATGKPNAFFDEMSASDVMKVCEGVATFLADGRATGQS